MDAYVRRAREFARPILEHVREVVHEGCPEVVETIKWGMPFFEHRGLLAFMAAFQAHGALGFWKDTLVVPEARRRSEEAMGTFGRLTSLRDLPPRATLLGYVRKAARLNEDGVKVERARATRRAAVRTPPALREALARSPKARAAYEALAPSHRRAYAAWIAEAQRDATRARRLATALASLAEGKPLRPKPPRR